MSNPPTGEEQGTSTRPYLIRALHDWCTDNGFTPYLAVHVTAGVQVPMEYVKNNEIVLNVGFEATTALSLGNDFVSFKARFGGVSRDISVPVDHVVAIYARENGQGMAFPMPSESPQVPEAGQPAVEPARSGLRLAPTVADEAQAQTAELADADGDDPPPDAPPAAPGRPSLKRVK